MIQINWMKTVLEFAIIIKTTIFETNIPMKNVAFMRFKFMDLFCFTEARLAQVLILLVVSND